MVLARFVSGWTLSVPSLPLSLCYLTATGALLPKIFLQAKCCKSPNTWKSLAQAVLLTAGRRGVAGGAGEPLLLEPGHTRMSPMERAVPWQATLGCCVNQHTQVARVTPNHGGNAKSGFISVPH